MITAKTGDPQGETVEAVFVHARPLRFVHPHRPDGGADGWAAVVHGKEDGGQTAPLFAGAEIIAKSPVLQAAHGQAEIDLACRLCWAEAEARVTAGIYCAHSPEGLEAARTVQNLKAQLAALTSQPAAHTG